MCICVCAHICLPVCVAGSLSVCLYFVRVYESTYVQDVYASMYAQVSIGVGVCACVCLCLCIYVCVCLRACTCIPKHHLSIATPRQPEAHQSAQASTLEHFCVLQPRWIMQVCGSCFRMLEGQILFGFHDNRGKRTCPKATVVCIEHLYSVF